MNTRIVKLDGFPETTDKRRFRLSVKVRDIILESDGSLRFWIERGDVSNLAHDCSVALLDDDICRKSA